MANKKRRWNCRWCAHCHIIDTRGKCTFNPGWVNIDHIEMHYCGQHKWNKEARWEIGEEIVGGM